MTEITRVPLRPIAKGSLAKLWIGVIVAVALAVLLAWSLSPKGVELTVVQPGTGPSPSDDDVIFVNYVGRLDDGTVFDESRPLPLPPQAQGIFPEGNPLPLGNMIPGFTEGAKKMQKGGKYELHIPADQGYGAEPPAGAPIPPNADLTFDVELIDFMSREEFDRRVAMITALMQQQGAMPGMTPGDLPPPDAAPMPEGAAPPQ